MIDYDWFAEYIAALNMIASFIGWTAISTVTVLFAMAIYKFIKNKRGDLNE